MHADREESYESDLVGGSRLIGSRMRDDGPAQAAVTFPIIAPLVRPTKQGIELGRNGGRLVLEGRRVVARCRDVRVGDVRSDEIRRHLEQGGEGWFRVDEQMSGPVAVCTLA